MAEFENSEHKGDIFSISVRAGKRTYFFDVRSTKSDDYYLTITESKRRFQDGSEKPFYEKHKLFLYKEDFEKFLDGLNEAMEHVNINRPNRVERQPYHNNGTQDNNSQDNGTPNETPSTEGNSFTNIEFDDLGKP